MTKNLRQAQLRALIETFLNERLGSKLEKLEPDDPKKAQEEEKFSISSWIPNAAQRSGSLQYVTHTLKPTHGDAKGSQLKVELQSLPALDEVGSHCLGAVYELDVVGNAAYLDVHKFLKLEHEGQTLRELVCANDADLGAVFSSNPEEADSLLQTFAAMLQPRGTPASHGYAKQLYWQCAGAQRVANVARAPFWRHRQGRAAGAQGRR